MSSFQDLGGFPFTITLRQPIKGVTRVLRRFARQRESVLRPTAHNSFGLLSQGYCEEKSLNLKKSTSNLSLILF